jgi:hypothetical protein
MHLPLFSRQLLFTLLGPLFLYHSFDTLPRLDWLKQLPTARNSIRSDFGGLSTAHVTFACISLDQLARFRSFATDDARALFLFVALRLFFFSLLVHFTIPLSVPPVFLSSARLVTLGLSPSSLTFPSLALTRQNALPRLFCLVEPSSSSSVACTCLTQFR